MSESEKAMVSEPVEPKTIRGSRGKVSIYLLGSLAFVYGGVTMQDHVFVGWSSVILFGTAALVFFWWFIRPPILLLDGNGFTLLGGFYRNRSKFSGEIWTAFSSTFCPEPTTQLPTVFDPKRLRRLRRSAKDSGLKSCCLVHGHCRLSRWSKL